MAKKSFLGVEIGNQRVKIAETKNGRLVRFAAADIPEDVVRQGEIVQWEAMGDFLKMTVKQNRFSTKNVALVVPDSIAFTRRTRMPPMSAAQLEFNLPYEFHDFIADDKDHYIYDYSMVELVKNEAGEVAEMDMLAVAVSKEIMERYSRMCKRAGLKLIVAAPENRAIGNVCRHLQPEVASGDYAVLDLGGGATRIDIFSNGIYEVTRSIDSGVNAIIEVVADTVGCDIHIADLYVRDNREDVLNSEACQDIYSRIAIDIMRAINYYTFEHRDNTLETMYYFGGGSSIGPLIQEIRDTIQLDLIPLSELATEAGDLADTLMDGPAAAGICWNE